MNILKENLDSVNSHECLGLIYGDGSLKKQVSFANTCPDLVNNILRFFKSLGIEKEAIKLYIQVYYSWDEVKGGDIIDYWIGKLDSIDQSNFMKIKRKERVARNIRNRKKPSKFGQVEICVYSKKLRESLVEAIAEVKDQPKTLKIPFLRGIIAAEGSIKLHNQVLREVRIASTKKDEQEFIRTLLTSVGIKPANANYDNYVAISGFTNLRLMSSYKLCSLHPEKDKLFNSGYQELESRKLPSPRV